MDGNRNRRRTRNEIRKSKEMKNISLTEALEVLQKESVRVSRGFLKNITFQFGTFLASENTPSLEINIQKLNSKEIVFLGSLISLLRLQRLSNVKGQPTYTIFKENDEHFEKALRKRSTYREPTPEWPIETRSSKRAKEGIYQDTRKSKRAKEENCQDTRKSKRAKEENCQDTSLSLSTETQNIVRELFLRHPPAEEELNACKHEIAVPSDDSNKGEESSEDFCMPKMSTVKIKQQLESYFSKLRTSEALQQISERRSKLPIASHKDALTSAIDSHQVVVIVGETGCGKTTQVPQFLLDHMWNQEKNCKILCTQPRRISAISVADRVAAERGENIGQTVGYKIRLESRGGRHSSLMFCTNGILLRKLIGARDKGMGDSQKLNPTHIIMDEIHERDRVADFMLIVLRELLPSRPDLRLVLMSATLDAEVFSKYFNNCPIVYVPGFTYPVSSYYLEDVLRLLDSKAGKIVSSQTVKSRASTSTEYDKAAMDKAVSFAWLQNDFDLLMEILEKNPSPNVCNHQHSLTGATPIMIAAGKGKVDLVHQLVAYGADLLLKSHDGGTALSWAERENQEESYHLIYDLINEKQHTSKSDEERLEKYLATVKSKDIDLNLFERLLIKICEGSEFSLSESEKGAILVFLSGWHEISRCKKCLEDSPIFSSSRYLILPLHSQVASEDQKKVFKRPLPGVRKIILSTNISETAVTIDDVTVVINSGFQKGKSYDPYRNLSIFQTNWISKASSKQREGRAGRCQPGACFHLFSRSQFDQMSNFQVPELQRSSLEDVCLQVKLLDPDSTIKDFLSKALDRPGDKAIENAVILLQDIGALTQEEKLTLLGKRLGLLPVSPLTSRMLLFAILMGCLDPALTIACALSDKDPFIVPSDNKETEKANAARLNLAAVYGEYSDHLGLVAAFDRWQLANKTGKGHGFCRENYLSYSAMFMLDGTRKQLWNELRRSGLVTKDLQSYSLNKQDSGILKMVILAGLYPRVGLFLPDPSGRRSKYMVITSSGRSVEINPHSSNHRYRSNDSSTELLGRPLVVFDEIIHSDFSVSMRNCTILNPHALVLLAAGLVVKSKSNRFLYKKESEDIHNIILSQPDDIVNVIVDKWLRIEMTSLDAAVLICLRERLSAALAFRIKQPKTKFPPVLGESLFATACLLSYDGDLPKNETDQTKA